MNQLVDPFSPVRPVGSPAIQPVRRPEVLSRRLTGRPVDRATVSKRQGIHKKMTAHSSSLASQGAMQATKTKPVDAKVTVLARVNSVLRIPVFIVLSLAFSFLLQSIVLGGAAVGLYATYIFVKRIPSKTSFQLSIVALIGIIALIILGTDAQLVSNFAIYALLLIIIGTISLAWEPN